MYMNPFQTFNNGYPAGYAGMMQHAVQPNVLPPQQVIRVNGKASVDAIRMSPDSSVIVMDSTAPMVWFCVSDGLGNVTAEPFDIFPHKEKKPEDEFEKRLAAVETQLKEVLNVKPDDGVIDAK